MSSIVNSVVGGVTGNTGGAGVNYQASAAPINNSYATQAQADQTYAQQQQALAQQQQFYNAAQAQNGLGNQTSTFNQLQGVANGTGPNPAQAQLAQATGANTANQAALMAGQRGSGANAGLIARQAAQQGGANQQNAAGQAATLQANQSLNALGQMGGLATSQANQQANALQGVQQGAQAGQSAILGGLGQQNTAINQSVGSQNSNNSSIANTVAGQQGNLLGNVMGGIGSSLMGSSGGAGGAAKAAGPVSQSVAEGGVIGQQKYAQGSGGVPIQSPISGTTPLNPVQPGSTAMSRIGQYFNKQQSSPSSTPVSPLAQGSHDFGQAIGSGIKSAYNYATTPSQAPTTTTTTTPSQTTEMAAEGGPMGQIQQLAPLAMLLAAEGGKVPVLLSPGERKLSPAEAKAAAGGQIDPMKAGKKVPGKPKVGGAKNDYANDTVKDNVEPGTLILPRSVTQAKHPAWAAHRFVQQHMAMAKGGKVK